MTAVEVLACLRSNGFTVTLAATGISIVPASSLTDVERAAIRAHRDELIHLLQVETPTKTDNWVRIVNAVEWVADLEARGLLPMPGDPAFGVHPFWSLTFPPGNCPIRDPSTRPGHPRRGRPATKPGPH